NNFNSSASSSWKNFARSRVSSASIGDSAAAGSPSPSSSMTRKSSSWFSNFWSGSILLRMTPASSMNPWAFSRLFQKASSAINELNSVKRFCKVATSKKPPQMCEFLGGGRQLWRDHFEHGDGEYRSEKRESSSESQRFCRRCSHRRHSRRSLNASHNRKSSSNSR